MIVHSTLGWRSHLRKGCRSTLCHSLYQDSILGSKINLYLRRGFFCMLYICVLSYLLDFFHTWILCCLSRSQVYNPGGVVGEATEGLPSPAGTCRWGGGGWGGTGGYSGPVLLGSAQIPDNRQAAHWGIYSLKDEVNDGKKEEIHSKWHNRPRQT